MFLSYAAFWLDASVKDPIKEGPKFNRIGPRCKHFDFFFQTDDEILAAFGADDSDDEKYDEADDAERRRDSINQTGKECRVL